MGSLSIARIVRAVAYWLSLPSPPKLRARARTSSSGSKVALPLSHWLLTRTRTFGWAAMLCAQPARRPCCEITHTPLSSARPVRGTRRGWPDLAPVVSNSTTSDERTPMRSIAATSGFATVRPTRRSNLNLRRPLLAIVNLQNVWLTTLIERSLKNKGVGGGCVDDSGG